MIPAQCTFDIAYFNVHVFLLMHCKHIVTLRFGYYCSRHIGFRKVKIYIQICIVQTLICIAIIESKKNIRGLNKTLCKRERGQAN